MRRFQSRLVLALCVVLFGIATLANAQEDRTAAEVLADLKSRPVPELDESRASDRTYMMKFRIERERAIRIRAAFVRELHYVDPTHAELPGLFNETWDHLLQVGRTEDILNDLKSIREKGATGALADKALYWEAFVRAREAVQFQTPNVDSMMARVRAFTNNFKTDPRSAFLLYAAARRMENGSDRQTEIYRELVTDYSATDYGRRAKTKIRQVEAIGQPFELTFTDAITGSEISVADLKGQVVVIDFWATWCGPCIGDLPHMKELYAKYHERGVEFIGVSLDQTEDKGGREALINFVKDNEIAWPQYYQGNHWQSDFSSSWGIDSIPALFVVDREGRLYSTRARGELETMIPQLLGDAERQKGGGIRTDQ